MTAVERGVRSERYRSAGRCIASIARTIKSNPVTPRRARGVTPGAFSFLSFPLRANERRTGRRAGKLVAAPEQPLDEIDHS